MAEDKRANAQLALVDVWGPPKPCAGSIAELIDIIGCPNPVRHALLRLSGENHELLDESLCEDLLLDTADLLGDTGNMSSLFYPHGEMVSASVISLMETGNVANDAFIQLLMTSYRATKRTGLCRLRLNLISSTSTGAKVLEFSSENEYWGVISAIKRAVDGDDEVYFQGSCQLPSSSDASSASSSSSAASASAPTSAQAGGGGRGGFFGMLSGGSKDGLHCEVRGPKLSIFTTTAGTSSSSSSSTANAGSGGSNNRVEVLTIDVTTLKALALSMDYEPIKPILIEAVLTTAADIRASAASVNGGGSRFSLPGNLPPNVSLNCLGSDGKLLPIESPTSICVSNNNRNINATDTVVIPVTVQEIQSGFAGSGIRQIAVCTGLVLSKTDSTGAGALGGVDIAATVEIPFSDFCKKRNLNSDSSSENNTNHGNDSSSSRLATPMKQRGPNEREVGEIVPVSVALEGTPDNVLSNVNHPVLTSVIMKQTVSKRAAYRLVIVSCQDLSYTNAKSKTMPSAYCTVYLVNEARDKLTVNSVEARTEVVQHRIDPEWNKEFLLRGEEEESGVAVQPAGVMIKIRDASSGFFRHKHIGQVVVPIECFVYQTEAKFCLPLEATYRMTDDVTQFFGEVHLITELISEEEAKARETATGPLSSTSKDTTATGSSNGSNIVEAPSGTPSQVTPSKRDSVKAIITPPPKRGSVLQPAARPKSGSMETIGPGFDPKAISVAFTLRRASSWSVWWPCKVLHGGGAPGHLLCSSGRLVIRLLSGAGGVLPVSLEAATNKDKDDGGGEINVLIPWNQVSSVVELTEAVLLVTVMVSYCVSSPQEQAKGVMVYSATELDLLIAPCPATFLHLVVMNRIAMWGVRSHFKSLVTSMRIDPVISDRASVDASSMPRRFSISTVILNTGGAMGTTTVHQLQTQPTTASSTSAQPGTSRMSVSSAEGRMSSPSSSPIPVRLNRASSQDWNNMSTEVLKLWQAGDVESIFSLARIVAEMLEGVLTETESYCLKLLKEGDPGSPVPSVHPFLRPGVVKSNSMSSLAQNSPRLGVRNESSHVNDTRAELFVSSQCYRYFRARIYLAILLHACHLFSSSTSVAANSATAAMRKTDAFLLTSSYAGASNNTLDDTALLIPSFDIELVAQLVDHDLKAAAHWASSYGDSSLWDRSPNALVSGIIRRHDGLLEQAVKRIRNFILCCYEHWDNTDKLIFDAKATTEPQTVNANDKRARSNQQARACIEELISGYHNGIRLLLFPYVGTRECFLRHAGQSLKTALLRMLIDKNNEFEERINPVLSVLGARCEPRLLLFETNALHSVVDWYSESVIAETKNWVSNALQNAYLHRKNRFDIPWDIHDDPQQTGSLYFSDLPETLMATLNIYLDLCTVDDMDQEYLAMANHPEVLREEAEEEQAAAKKQLMATKEKEEAEQKTKTLTRSTTFHRMKVLAKQVSSNLVADDPKQKRKSLNAADASKLKTIEEESAPTSGATRRPSGSGSSGSSHPTESIDSSSQQFLIQRQLKRKAEKMRFFLKMNEKIVRAVGQCIHILGDEYGRALQRKHWERGNKDSGELNANMAFLVATGNDADRVVSKHINSISNSIQTAVIPAVVILQEITKGYGELQEVAAKHISKILFNDLQPILLDFDNLWMDYNANAPKMITSALSYYLRELQSSCCDSLYHSILGHCAEVCALRYLLLLRHRAERGLQAASGGSSGSSSSGSSKFSAAEIARLSNDVKMLKKYFLDEEDTSSTKQAAAGDNHNVPGDDEEEKKPGPAAASLGQGCYWRCRRAISNLEEVLSLLTTPFDNESFVGLCRVMVKRYKVSSNVVPGQISSGIASSSLPGLVAYNLLTSVASHLRPDAGGAIQNLVNIVLENHGRRVSGSYTGDDGGQFGNHFAHSGAHARAFVPGVTNTYQAPPHPEGSPLSDPIARVFASPMDDGGGQHKHSSMMSSVLSHVPGTSSGGSSSTPLKSGTPAKTQKPLAGTPQNTIKSLREKAADGLGGLTGIGSKKAAQRRLDEQATDMMRILGLESDLLSISPDKEDVRSPGTTNAGNNKDDDGGSDAGKGSVSDYSEWTGMGDSVLGGAENMGGTDVCTIRVTDMKLRGVKSGSLIGSANPYVVVNLGNSQREKTKVIWGMKDNWSWGSETLLFRISASRLAQHKLVVRVYDKERIRRKKLLGGVNVKLAGLDVRGISSWFALEGGESGSAGEVFLSVTLEDSSINTGSYGAAVPWLYKDKSAATAPVTSSDQPSAAKEHHSLFSGFHFGGKSTH